jgi:hypothetical protein
MALPPNAAPPWPVTAIRFLNEAAPQYTAPPLSGVVKIERFIAAIPRTTYRTRPADRVATTYRARIGHLGFSFL